jgi:ATP-dependent RNA helicase DDX23/PRP28
VAAAKVSTFTRPIALTTFCLPQSRSARTDVLTCCVAQPKFLSKKERERRAIERREKEVEAQKTTAGQLNGSFQNGTQAFASARNSTPQSGKAIPTGPRSLRQGEIPTGPASMRPSHGNGKANMAPPAVSQAASATKQARTGDKRAPADSEAALIRQRYMGADQNQSTFSAKKKRRRTTEKKFNFEWNAEEDTSIDHNPIYASRVEANFYGRGHLGGLDADSKTQEYAKALKERDGEAGSKRAQIMLDMERQKKAGSRRAALDMHWSEKALEDMRERDWRIFKEDFSISTKGGAIPNPMRNWAESHLPKRILEIVQQVGYTEPSPVQRAAIPIAMQSRDLIGIAVTGSGKTAAFLLPLLTYITALPPLDKENRIVLPLSPCKVLSMPPLSPFPISILVLSSRRLHPPYSRF